MNQVDLNRAETVMLMLTGDVMIGRGIDQILPVSVEPTLYESYMRSAIGYVEIAEEENGPIPRDVEPAYIWGDALEVLERYDPTARIINLETAITDGGQPWPAKGIHYRAHPANAEILAAAGIDCAVLANNHVLDWGQEGLLETLDTLEMVGVETVGAGGDFSEASAPTTLTTPIGRIIVFAMAHESSGVPKAWLATAERPGLRLLPDLSEETASRIAEEIRAIRRDGDQVVVSIHWGGNWGYSVPSEQERFGKALIDLGAADLIHGHSSHHPKGIELYQDRLIIYGAGDLINDYEGIGGHDEYRPELSLLYLPRLSENGEMVSMTLVPFRIERFRLNRATTEESAWLLERIASYSKGAAFTLSEDGSIEVRPQRSGK